MSLRLRMIIPRKDDIPVLSPAVLRRVARRVHRRLVSRANSEIPARARAELAFLDRETMRSLNLRFRDEDAATDVLSFTFSDGDPDGVFFPAGSPEEKLPLFGVLVICPPVAAANARRKRHSLLWEMAFLLAHGLLHLAGWEHRRTGQLERMNELCRRALQDVFAPE